MNAPFIEVLLKGKQVDKEKKLLLHNSQVLHRLFLRKRSQIVWNNNY